MLCPALLGPAPLSGVRARAGAGRGYELQDLGGGSGVSLRLLQKLGRIVLKGPSLCPSRTQQSKTPPSLPSRAAWRSLFAARREPMSSPSLPVVWAQQGPRLSALP